MNLPLVSNPAL